jgi:cyclopropane-fatty-acyl-phospholipid synthase
MALAKVSAPLAREIERWAPTRPFSLRFWDGVELPANTDEQFSREQLPTFYVRKPSALGHLLRAPGRLGLGRAWVEGSLQVDDIDRAFLVVDSWQPPPLRAFERARLGVATLLAAAPGGVPRRPRIELVLRGDRHTIARDADAVRYHYDVGNEFFQLFLDDSLTYSCGIFSRGASTLEQAQQAKLDIVAQKLDLKPGQRVLDVGCGWGSFAIHAATHYGVSVTGITLSPAQVELARRRVAEAGVAERVQIRLADYREIVEEPFDAICSIGMSEHVGESLIDAYAAALAGALRPGGLLLNHAIALIRTDEDPLADEFTMRYVFPDGEPLPLSRVQLALERAGLLTEHVEGFVEDYATTLRHWAERLDRNLPRAEELAGEQRTRVWRLYLRAARQGFEDGYTAVYQVKARRLG